MRDLHLYLLSQGEQRLLHEMVEEKHLLEDGLVGLFEIVSPEGSWQLGHKLHLLLNIEQLLDVGMLLDIIIDPPGERLADIVLIYQLLKDLHVFALHNILGADVGDQRSDAVDVIGQHHAADSLDEDHTKRLLIAHWHHIPKPNREHNRRSPIVRPYILFKPRSVHYILAHLPILLGVEVGHGDQKNGEHVSKAEVKEKNLEQ